MIVDATLPGVSRRPNATARNKIIPLAAAVVALTLQAPSSASVNTQEWRDTGGTLVSSMDKDGRLTAANLTLTGFSGVLKTSAGVVAGSATTTDLPEGSNLYFTDERVDDRVNGLLVAGAGISLAYDDALNTLTITGTVSAYTDEMAQDAAASLIQNGTGISWSYNDALNTLTPTVTLSPFSTTNLSEGTRLYYTDARAQAAITGTVNRITVTAGVVDISAAYVGQASLTTLGTIGTGTWQGTSISTTYTDAKIKTVVGTTNRLTIGGTATDPTFDISTSYVGQATITTLGTIGTGVWQGTAIVVTYGGTGAATLASNGVLYGNGTSAVQALAVNSTATNKFLTQSSSAAPAWAALVAGDIPTSLPAVTAGKATILETARAINGTNFDGSAAITITAAAGTLTGATLAAGVTASSLTSLGTVTSFSAGTVTATSNISITGAAFLQLNNSAATMSIGTTASTTNALDISNSLTGLTGSTQRGLFSHPTFSSAATTTGIAIQALLVTAAAAYTMTTGRGILISDATKGAGSTITTQIGLEISNQTQGGTNYAIKAGTGLISSADTTDASSSTVGAVIISGGIALAKTLYTASDIKLGTAGNGIYIKEGSNATMGTATLVLGTATVSTSKVTANSRIFLSVESLGTISSPVAVSVTGRSAGTSFTITSANLTDTSVVAWHILEPA